jgi:hypothetical protein
LSAALRGPIGISDRETTCHDTRRLPKRVMTKCY